MSKINNFLLFFLFILTQQSSLVLAWQVNVAVELHDMQLHGLSLGVQTSNALTKKLYADSLFFKLCYNTKTGVYCNVTLHEQKMNKSKNRTTIDYAAQCFSLALIKNITFYAKQCYQEITQKAPADINLPSEKRYNRAIISFESVTNHVINGFVSGVVSGEQVKEVYNAIQKVLTYAKDEQKKRLSDNKFCKKLVMINGTLSLYDDQQELLKKIDTLEKLAKKLKKIC